MPMIVNSNIRFSGDFTKMAHSEFPSDCGILRLVLQLALSSEWFHIIFYLHLTTGSTDFQSKKHLIFWWNKRSNFITLQIYHNFCLLAAFHDCTVFTYFQHCLYQNFVYLYLNIWSTEYRFKINILSFFNKLSVFLIPSQMNFGSEQNFYFHNCIIYI